MGDLLVVGSCKGIVHALDKETGHVKWEYDIRKDGDQRQFHGDPLITDELVVIGTDGNMGHVYAFERTTGAVRWKYRVDERGVTSDVAHREDPLAWQYNLNRVASKGEDNGNKENQKQIRGDG